MYAILYATVPETGKTYCSQNAEEDVIDLSSDKFPTDGFPDNYIKDIVKQMSNYDVFCVDSNEEVRDALVDAGLKFTLIYPEGMDDMENQVGCNHIVLKEGEFLSDVM